MFECHVTVRMPIDEVGYDALAYEKLAAEFGWKTSVIHGDPLLGPGGKFYFTAHAKDFLPLLEKMNLLTNRFSGRMLMRRKIELIVLDERFDT